MKQLLLAAALTVGLPTLSLAEQPLSDDQAIAVIEAYWNAALLHVPLGTFDVVSDDSEGGPNAMPESALERWYLPLQQAGVIAITEEPGAAKKIAVTVTAEGRKKNVSDDPAMLAMRQGMPKIEKITRNEAIHRGADDYRIVGAQYIANWEDAVAGVLAYCGNAVTPEQKSVVLLKFDPVAGEWRVLAEDDANAADAFCTQKVASALP
jgi:hypothetical protein